MRQKPQDKPHRGVASKESCMQSTSTSTLTHKKGRDAFTPRQSESIPKKIQMGSCKTIYSSETQSGFQRINSCWRINTKQFCGYL